MSNAKNFAHWKDLSSLPPFRTSPGYVLIASNTHFWVDSAYHTQSSVNQDPIFSSSVNSSFGNYSQVIVRVIKQHSGSKRHRNLSYFLMLHPHAFSHCSSPVSHIPLQPDDRSSCAHPTLLLGGSPILSLLWASRLQGNSGAHAQVFLLYQVPVISQKLFLKRRRDIAEDHMVLASNPTSIQWFSYGGFTKALHSIPICHRHFSNH